MRPLLLFHVFQAVAKAALALLLFMFFQAMAKVALPLLMQFQQWSMWNIDKLPTTCMHNVVD